MDQLLSNFPKHCAALLMSIVAVISLGLTVNAAPVTGFNAGNIIDDSVFANSQTMNPAQIQAFFESKVSKCDTWGTGGSTPTARRDYIRSKGYDVPLKCLIDYTENGRTAAQIVYDTAQKYQINPQVLIVLLQKEQGLVTDDWPGEWQWRTATGYGCPDTAPCDSQYYGLTNQLDWAAKMFRAIMNNTPQSQWYTPYVLGNNYIQYSPDASCGGSTVNIQNRATQALYNYTPYQPNQGALNAGWGEAYCGAYGNRNFYLYFTEWFGSTQGSLAVSDLAITRDAAGQVFTGKPVEVSFTVKNVTKYNYTFNTIGVAVRGPSGENLDPGWASNVSIDPGATYVYRKTFTPVNEGGYKIYLSSYASQDTGWRECELDRSESTCYEPKIIQNPIKITTTPVIKRLTTGQNIDTLRQKQAFAISYNLVNTSQKYPVKLGSVILAGRTSVGKNRDLAWRDVGILTAGQVYTYQASGMFNDEPGTTYRFFVSATKDGGRTYEEQAFTASDATIKQQVQTTIKSGVTLIEGPVIIPGSGAVGAKSTLTVKVRNWTDSSIDLGRIGVTVRGPQGQNKDPLWQRVDNLSSSTNDGIHTYEASFTPTVAGTWNIAYMRTSADFSSWDATYPAAENSSVSRSVSLPVQEAVSLFEGPRMSSSQSYVGRPTTVSLKLKTAVSGPVDLGRIGVTVRGPQGQNKDPLWQRVDNLSSSTNDGIHTYEASFTPTATGVWTLGYMHATSNFSEWNSSYPASSNSDVQRTIKISVLPQATLTSGITFSSVALGARQAMFTVTNHGSTDLNLGSLGLAVRDPDGVNRDALWEDFNIPANSSKTHTVGVNFDKVGKWSFVVTAFRDGKWTTATPVNDNIQIQRSVTVDVK